MSRLSRGIVWVYAQLLRLYPARFRHEFVGEMREVFEQAAQDTDGRLALLALFMGEMRDLPLNLIREHIRARRKNVLNLDGEVIVMNPFQSRQLFRTSVTASLAMFSLYCMIVIRPVLALNLDAPSMQAVHSGELNVYYYVAEGFFQYRPVAPEDEGTLQGFLQRDTWQAVVMGLVGKSILVTGPIAAVLLGSILIFNLGKNWRSMRRWQLIIGGASMAANILLIVFMFLPTGHLVMHWWDMTL
jgi:hypothetical protein